MHRHRHLVQLTCAALMLASVLPHATGVTFALTRDPIYPELGNPGYDARHYTIALDVNPARNRINSATMTMEATALADMNRLTLDFADMTVSGATVNGELARTQRQRNKLTLTPLHSIDISSTFTVAVRYAGTPVPVKDASAPTQLGWQSQDGAVWVVSEPSGAMNWFPHNNHPSDKATYMFSVTVPSGYIVAANGVLLGTTVNMSGNRARYVWDMSQPMASYLATINIDQFDVVTNTTPSGVVIRNYFPHDTPDNVRAKFDDTLKMMDFLEKLIAPYPFKQYGSVIIPDRGGWALETQTLSTYTRNGPSSPSAIFHELAHQWFGNHVSPSSWQDIWLNEGFATYLSFLWSDGISQRPYDRAMRDVYGFIVDRNVPPPIPDTKSELFDASVYLRGAYALHALRATVGDEAFFRILREYYKRFAGGNASTGDFIKLAKEIGGQRAESVLRAWLSQEGVPPEV